MDTPSSRLLMFEATVRLWPPVPVTIVASLSVPPASVNVLFTCTVCATVSVPPVIVNGLFDDRLRISVLPER